MEKLRLKFVYIINALFPKRFCWTSCVHWAMSSKDWNIFDIQKSKECLEDSKTNNACYCGQFVDGKVFSRLSKKEQNKLRLKNMANVDDLLIDMNEN